MTNPALAYINHQCARFVIRTKTEHATAVRRIGRYIKNTPGKGIVFKTDKNKGLECYVDADFAGNWDPKDTQNKDTARSRHGYIISYAGRPLICKSQLQTEIALSSTESEYTGLLYAMRKVIPTINLLKEMDTKGFSISGRKSTITCAIFEDNSGAIEMAKNGKYRPRTKHLDIKLHHFRHHVDQGLIKIIHIRTNSHPADVLTKPLPEESFLCHRKTLMVW